MKRKASIPRICRVFRGAIISKSSILAAALQNVFMKNSNHYVISIGFQSGIVNIYSTPRSGSNVQDSIRILPPPSGFTVGFTLLLVRRDVASMRLPN
jgi:hypothetical protein